MLLGIYRAGTCGYDPCIRPLDYLEVAFRLDKLGQGSPRLFPALSVQHLPAVFGIHAIW